MAVIYFAWACAVASSASVSADEFVRTVAISGARAPGAGEGVIFEDFRRYTAFGARLVTPVINNQGQVAFTGTIRGASRSDAMFSEGAGDGLTLIARASAPAVGSEGEIFIENLSASIRIDDEGDVYFRAAIQGSSGFAGYFRHAQSMLDRIDTRDELFPSALPDQHLTMRVSPLLSDGGLAFFQASLLEVIDDGDPFTPDEVRRDHAIFRERPGGGFDRIVTEGEAAPGVGPGITLGPVDPPSIASHTVFEMRDLRNSGQSQLVFRTKLKGVGVTDSNAHAVYRVTPDDSRLVLIARDGDPAPGSGPDVTLRLGSAPARTNLSGHTYFSAGLRGPDNSNRGPGIFSDDNSGSKRPVALFGETAPGAEGDFLFDSFSFLQINEHSEAAFRAGMRSSGSYEHGIFMTREHDLEMVAMTGQAAPFTDSGVVIRSGSGISGGFAFNARGQVAFNANLAGPSINHFNDRALYATDSDGELHLIVREGSILDVSDDPAVQDLRTVSVFHFEAGNEIYTGTQLGFNAHGQIVFSAEFTDGTEGVFVSNMVAVVPEPASLTNIGILTAAITYPWRLRRKG